MLPIEQEANNGNKQQILCNILATSFSGCKLRLSQAVTRWNDKFIISEDILNF